MRGTVKGARVSVGDGVKCIIPIRAPRGKIGGGGLYGATGGAHGWNIKGKYKINARIMKGGKSTLPGNMSNIGGQPPFRNYDAGSLNGMTFTRTGKERLPIKPVVGIGIPQMPMNKSKGAVEKDIKKLLEGRMEHVLQQVLMGNIK